MGKFYTNTYSEINLYKKKTIKSEILTQMIYGDSFSVIKKNKKWSKIKIKEDGYIGYIKNKNFKHYIKPTHKISKLAANIYKKPNFKKSSGKLSFSSFCDPKQLIFLREICFNKLFWPKHLIYSLNLKMALKDAFII